MMDQPPIMAVMEAMDVAVWLIALQDQCIPVPQAQAQAQAVPPSSRHQSCASLGWLPLSATPPPRATHLNSRASCRSSLRASLPVANKKPLPFSNSDSACSGAGGARQVGKQCWETGNGLGAEVTACPTTE
jgi:hypothetical protein